MHLRIGSRGSLLAMWQSGHVAALLREHGHTAEIVLIRTTGDRMQEPAYAAAHPVTPELDAKGMFIKEIEQALEDGTIDLAVHSLKDLPTTLDARFALPAIPERADPRDALLCPEWLQMHTLPAGARIGTTSPRRTAQLRAHRPDLQFVPIRGNIDTRIRKLRRGECDALVLACAGLDRLGPRLLRRVELDPAHPEYGRAAHIECVTHAGHDHLESHPESSAEEEHAGQHDWIRERFAPEVLCPAPGQGALAIETRSNDDVVSAAVAVLDHAPTRFCVEAERWVLHAMGGGCQLPVGALCRHEADGRAVLNAAVTAPDGEQMIAATLTCEIRETAEEFGTRVAQRLLRDGARELLAGEVFEPLTGSF